MGLYEEEMGAKKKGTELKEELATAQPSAYNRFKTSVSNTVYRCTFGKFGTAKEASGDCPFTEDV